MENPELIHAICDYITNILIKNILFGWNKKSTLTKNKNVKKLKKKVLSPTILGTYWTLLHCSNEHRI